MVALLAGCGRFGFEDAQLSTADAVSDGPVGGRTFAYVIDGTSVARTKTFLHVLDVADDGSLSPSAIATAEVRAKPLALRANADGSRLYVTTRDNSSLYTFAIDPQTGALTELDRQTIGMYSYMVTLHPNGRWLYATNWMSPPRVDGFELDANGVPTPLAGSPFTFVGSTAIWIDIHPNGQWAYVLDNTTSEVHAMAISQTTGALTPLAVTPWDSLDSGAYAVLIDATGKYGFISFDNNSTFPAFTIDLATGAMSTTPGSPFNYAGANTCMDAAMDRTRTKVFIADDGSGGNTLGAFRVDTTSGAPVPLQNSPFPTPDVMWGVAASPVSDDVYTTTAGSSPAILHFRADSTTVTKIGTHDVPGLDAADRLTVVRTTQ